MRANVLRTYVRPRFPIHETVSISDLTLETEIDAVADVKIWKGQFEDLSRKAATGADLTEIVKVIDRQKERDKAVGRAAASDNVTIAICSLIVLVKRGLLTNNDNQAANSDFTKMTTGAMNQMRETFARQMTQLSV